MYSLAVYGQSSFNARCTAYRLKPFFLSFDKNSSSEDGFEQLARYSTKRDDGG
jgi:hypothetical protein